MLLLLKEAGLTRLNFGVESVNLGVLKLMKKQVDPDSMRRAFTLCGKHGVATMCGLMMGNPGDTRKTILESAWFVRSIPEVRYSPIGIAIPYPGTELLEIARKGEHGLKLIESDFSKFTRFAGGVMEVDGMKPEELWRLQTLAIFIIHSTPAKIAALIRHFGFWNLLRATAARLSSLLVSFWTSPLPAGDLASQNTTLNSLDYSKRNTK